MRKFNHKFNNACSRVAFWDTLTNQLVTFEALLKPDPRLRPDERQVLQDIHTLLYECYQASKSRRKKHLQELGKLRKEIRTCR